MVLMTKAEPVQALFERRLCGCVPEGAPLQHKFSTAARGLPAQYFYECSKCGATYALEDRAEKLVIKNVSGEELCRL